MPISDDKADELARASRSLAKDARAVLKASEKLEDELKAENASLRADSAAQAAKIAFLEQWRANMEGQRSTTNRVLDMAAADAVLRRALAVVVVALSIAIVAVALVYSPSLLSMIPLLGGLRAP